MTMNDPIELPVSSVWDDGDTYDLIFGIPGHWDHDGPTITIRRDLLPRPPEVGDIMRVIPPQVLGFAE